MSREPFLGYIAPEGENFWPGGPQTGLLSGEIINSACADVHSSPMGTRTDLIFPKPTCWILPDASKGRLGRTSYVMDVAARHDRSNPVCPRLRFPEAWLDSLIRLAGQPMGPVTSASDAILTKTIRGQVRRVGDTRKATTPGLH